MRLKIINSNSEGNAYILENEHEALLIECGVRFELIKRALQFNLKKVVGCLLTHEHGDHAKSVHDVQKHGIDVYASFGTHAVLGTTRSHRTIAVQNGQPFNVGSFRVQPFDVKHDVREPLGFLIYHKECGLTLFMTDTYYSEYYFSGLNNVIIEANYCDKIVDEHIARGGNIQYRKNRLITSHMSLETCKKFLRINDLTNVHNIVLIHLSNENSHADRFKKEVEEATGKRVHIASKGLVIENFNKQPF